MDEYYLGIRIKIARKQAGFSQEELAKALNITVNSINRYEKGHRKPDADVLSRMVDILHCDPAWLLQGPKEKQNTLKYRVLSEEQPFSASESPAEPYGDPEIIEIMQMLKENPQDKKLVLKLLKGKKDIKEAMEGFEVSNIKKQEE